MFGIEGTTEENDPMKKLLLATVATLALTASGFAAEEHGKAGAEMKGQAQAPAGGAQMKGNAATDTKGGAQMKGQAQAPAATGKSEMKGSANNAEKSKSRETTGQGSQGTEMKTT